MPPELSLAILEIPKPCEKYFPLYFPLFFSSVTLSSSSGEWPATTGALVALVKKHSRYNNTGE